MTNWQYMMLGSVMTLAVMAAFRLFRRAWRYISERRGGTAEKKADFHGRREEAIAASNAMRRRSIAAGLKETIIFCFSHPLLCFEFAVSFLEVIVLYVFVTAIRALLLCFIAFLIIEAVLPDIDKTWKTAAMILITVITALKTLKELFCHDAEDYDAQQHSSPAPPTKSESVFDTVVSAMLISWMWGSIFGSKDQS